MYMSPSPPTGREGGAQQRQFAPGTQCEGGPKQSWTLSNKFHCIVDSKSACFFCFTLMLLMQTSFFSLCRCWLGPIRRTFQTPKQRVQFIDPLRQELLLRLPSHHVQLFEGQNLLNRHCCHTAGSHNEIMKEQAIDFERKGLSAAYITFGLVGRERKMQNVLDGLYDLVFISPEQLLMKWCWRETLHSESYLGMVAFVVDEAHCVKKW